MRGRAVFYVLITASAACGLFYPFDLGDGGSVPDANIVDGDALIDGAGAPLVVATTINGSSLADDDAALYWFSSLSDGGIAALMRTSKTDGATTTILDDAGTKPIALVVSDDVFLWSVRTTLDAGAVNAMAHDASVPTVLASQLNWTPDGFARDDAGAIYVLNSPGISPVLSRIETDGGLTTLTTNVIPNMQAAESLALDDQFVYWAHNSQVLRLRRSCPDDSGTCLVPETVVKDTANEYGIRDIAVDDASVYWETFNISSYLLGLYRTPKGMTAPDAAIVLFPIGIHEELVGLVLGGDNAYCVLDSVFITRVGKDGSGKVTLAKGAPKQPLVVDDNWVYWIDTAQNQILKVPR